MKDLKNESTERLNGYYGELDRIFKRARTRHDAHAQSVPVLERMARDPHFLQDGLRSLLTKDDALNITNYPVIGIMIYANQEYNIILNCWIPHPDRATDVATKPIHHHGDLLISSATAFGPGYEHWMFTTPALLDQERELYHMDLLERAPHPLHEVIFVDNYICHLPVFPPSLTVTIALWSSKYTITWRDKVKRMPALQKNKQAVRNLAIRLGFSKQLQINNKEYIDFYPTPEGFRGLKEPHAFPNGPNEDYLHSLFHVMQQVGGDGLAPDVERVLNSGMPLQNSDVVRTLLTDLKAGRPIEGRLSARHYDVPEWNFRVAEIEEALAAQKARTGAPVAA